MKRPAELQSITRESILNYLPNNIPEQLGVLDMCIVWLRDDIHHVTHEKTTLEQKHQVLSADLAVANHKAAKLADDLRLVTGQSRAAQSKWDVADAQLQITETPAMRAAAAALAAAQQERDRIQGELQHVKTRIAELQRQAEDMESLRTWCASLIERQAALLRGQIIKPHMLSTVEHG